MAPFKKSKSVEEWIREIELFQKWLKEVNGHADRLMVPLLARLRALDAERRSIISLHGDHDRKKAQGEHLKYLLALEKGSEDVVSLYDKLDAHVKDTVKFINFEEEDPDRRDRALWEAEKVCINLQPMVEYQLKRSLEEEAHDRRPAVENHPDASSQSFRRSILQQLEASRR